jgi:hypothetical protein
MFAPGSPDPRDTNDGGVNCRQLLETLERIEGQVRGLSEELRQIKDALKSDDR